MKQFKNLDEAFHHHHSCPFCNEPMKLGYSRLLVLESKTIVTFQVGDATIDVDYYDNDVIWHSEKSKPSKLEMFRVLTTCDSCSKYGYVLQVHVDSDVMKVIGIYLNSETFSIELGDELYEIKNLYSTGKTTYDKFDRVNIDTETVKASGWSGRRNSTISFPLIPMDINNPEKTLDRIKGLVIFS